MTIMALYCAAVPAALLAIHAILSVIRAIIY